MPPPFDQDPGGFQLATRPGASPVSGRGEVIGTALASSKLSLCLFLLSVTLNLPVRAGVVISEFMAANTNTTIVDEDGSHSDWIELQNNGTTTVSLNGWYLTDNSSDLRKWQFPITSPAVSLAAGARLVVWASEKNRKTAVNRLHTNFKLNAGGEYLALVQPGPEYTVEFELAPEYPPQATDVSYGVSGGRQWNVLAGPTLNTQWKVRVPQNEADFVTSMAGWNSNAAFNTTTTWATKGTYIGTEGPKGIGYDSGGSTGTRAYLINYSGSPNGVVASTGDLGGSTTGMTTTGMRNTGTFTGVPTLCARTTFNVTDKSTISQLRLNLRYDDGFIVYLNGTELLRVNAPSTVAWNSAAAADREDDQSEQYATLSLPGAASYLLNGTNLLAIHGFNESKNSSHFVITPSLEAFQAATGAGAYGYLQAPTPNAENTVATSTIGPDIAQTTRNPLQPVGGTGSAPLLVTARLRQTLNPVSTVTCKYIINFGSETSVTMRNDGIAPDLSATDEIYSAEIPTTGLSPGHLLRWRIVATDTSANQSADPPYRDPYDNDQYFGTMAQTPGVQSQLPVLYWFHNSTSTDVFATNEGGFRSMFFYRLPGEATGTYYDNIRVNLHGQSSAGPLFLKKSQNLYFNADNRFRWRANEKQIRSLNLLSNWADKSHVRNSIAWETWNRTMQPSHWCQTIRVQQVTSGNLNSGADAQFLCLTDMVEDGNEEFLERWDLDSTGALYKCYNSLENVSQNSSTNGSGVEKKTREWEDFSDLQTLETAMNTTNSVSARRQWLYDNVDVAGLINFLAVHNLIQSHDFGHKNYYMYRDTNGTGEWTPLPWDQDLSLGHRWDSYQGYFDDDLFTAGGIFIGGGGNRLMNIVNTSGATELTQMYVCRLRTLMDQYYGPSAAPVSHWDNRLDACLDTMDPPNWPVTTDAERDFQKWGFWIEGTPTGQATSSGPSTLAWTDARAQYHRIRPSTVRIKSANDLANYPGENPYTRYDSSLNPPERAFGATSGLHTSIEPFLPGRRKYLYNENGLNPSINGQTIPATQPLNPALAIDTTAGGINPNSTTLGQDREYFVIRNPNSYAVDLSGWKLSGSITHTLKPGTVIPAQGTSTSDGGSTSYVNQLNIVRKPTGFRGINQNLYRFVQGGYSRQLSARGGTISLSRPDNPLELATTTYTTVLTVNYTATPTASQNDLRITELNYAPAAPTAAELAALPGVQAGDFEFVELTNTGSSTLSLAGAKFDEGISFTFPAGFSLAAGARTLVLSNRAAFELRYGSGFNIAGVFEGSLDNAGERLQLLDSVGEVVLDFTYDPTWYPPTDKGGYSLVTAVTAAPWDQYSLTTNWALGGGNGGSPGYADAFEGWRYGYFTPAEQGQPAISGLTADPEHDGWNNWSEYCFGTHPKQANARLATGTLANVSGTDYLAISFDRRKGARDIQYTVEASSDLAGWTPVDLPVGSPQSLGNGIERVTYRDSEPFSGPRRFLRVRAHQPP